MHYIDIKNKKGAALIFVLTIIVMVSVILTSLIGFITTQVRYSNDKVERERAFQIAESGVYFYRWYLAHEVSGKTAQQIKDFWQNGNPYGVNADYENEYADQETGPIGKYSIHVDRPALGSTIVIVTSTGWTYKNPNIKRIIRVRFRRPSWSENTVLANDNMRFGQGTVVSGKIHSNKGIRFDGLAKNIVSSSLDKYDDLDHAGGDEFAVHTHKNPAPSNAINDNFRPAEAPPSVITSRNDVFQVGRQFPLPQVSFVGVVSDLSFMRSSAAIKYDNSGAGRRIMLKADGTFDVCKVNSFDSSTNAITNYSGIVTGATGGSSGTNGNACVANACCVYASCGWIQNGNHSKGKCVSMTNAAIPSDGVIFVANNAWVEGTVNNKKISIVAAELSDEPGYTGIAKNIFLGMNNILYTNTDGKDIIGLIAQNNIEVIRDSLNILTIDAALLAKDGRVGRDNYGNTKSTITVNGSIATNLRYGFAYTNGTGYTTRNLNFDNNLLYYPPPYFPTGTEYSIDLWDEL